MKLQKVGGYAAISCVLILVILLGIAIFGHTGLLGLNDSAKGVSDLGSTLAFSAYCFMIILAGIAAVLLILALSERLKAIAPNLMRLAVIGVAISSGLCFVIGFVGIVGMPSIVSTGDLSAFRAVAALLSGLLFGADFTLGSAYLLTGCVALKTKGLPRVLSYLLIIKGLIMICEFGKIPLSTAGALLGVVGVYPWLAIVLLRSKGLSEVPSSEILSRSYSKM